MNKCEFCAQVLTPAQPGRVRTAVFASPRETPTNVTVPRASEANSVRPVRETPTPLFRHARLLFHWFVLIIVPFVPLRGGRFPKMSLPERRVSAFLRRLRRKSQMFLRRRVQAGGGRTAVHRRGYKHDRSVQAPMHLVRICGETRADQTVASPCSGVSLRTAAPT